MIHGEVQSLHICHVKLFLTLIVDGRLVCLFHRRLILELVENWLNLFTNYNNDKYSDYLTCVI
jgi:hypothetical protein